MPGGRFCPLSPQSPKIAVRAETRHPRPAKSGARAENARHRNLRATPFIVMSRRPCGDAADRVRRLRIRLALYTIRPMTPMVAIKPRARRRIPVSVSSAKSLPPSQGAARNGTHRTKADIVIVLVTAPAPISITRPITEIDVTNTVTLARVTACGSGPRADKESPATHRAGGVEENADERPR